MKLEIIFKDGKKGTLESVVKFNVTEKQTANEECHTLDVAHAPREGEPFRINPLEIYRSNFEKTMKDSKQEWTRKMIQKAFAEVDKHPELYASQFYTLVPKKKWDDYKTVAELQKYANDLGGIMADWVEQALEWAQRIFNGESWEDICNYADTSSWHRMIIVNDADFRIVGGSRNSYNNNPASLVSGMGVNSGYKIKTAVPLVVFKKLPTVIRF